MNRQIEELCGDPLFQLNMAIWLSQSKPGDFGVRPIFYESGFRIRSIGPRLTIPPDIRLILNKTKIEYHESVAPDVILSSDNHTKICILECKKSSFGIGSSNSFQANTLLVISGPAAAEILGVGLRDQSNGILAYMTRSGHVDDLQDTLKKLKKDLFRTNIDSGEPGCFGLGCTAKAVTISYTANIGEAMDINPYSPVEVLSIDDDTDPRPLYIIPYDPASINQHSQEEEKICRRILYERFLSHVLCKVGSANAPVDIKIPIDEILNISTFHFFEIWEDRSVRKNFKSLLKEFMMSLREYLDDEDILNFETGVGWVIKIKDGTTHDNIIKKITKFQPDGMKLDEEIVPSLFEE